MSALKFGPLSSAAEARAHGVTESAILQEPLEDPVYRLGMQYYNAGELAEWSRRNPTDPYTRAPLTPAERIDLLAYNDDMDHPHFSPAVSDDDEADFEELVNRLLESTRGMLEDIRGIVEHADPPITNRHLSEALIHACYAGDVDAVRYLVDAGADIDIESYLNKTPLYEAVCAGATEVVAFLLEAGAYIADDDETLLPNAARGGHTDVTRLLIEAGGDVEPWGGHLALVEACRYGYADIVDVLIDKGNADIEASEGEALLVAVRADKGGVVQTLIDHGASTERGDFAALREAVALGHTGVVQALLGATTPARFRASHIDVSALNTSHNRQEVGRVLRDFNRV